MNHTKTIRQYLQVVENLRTLKLAIHVSLHLILKLFLTASFRLKSLLLERLNSDLVPGVCDRESYLDVFLSIHYWRYLGQNR